MSPYATRPAVVADAEALGRIRTEAWRRAYPGIVAVRCSTGSTPRPRRLVSRPRMHADGVRVAVAVADDGAVGAYCIYGADRDEPAPGPGGGLRHLRRPGCWRTGAGGRAARRVRADLAAAGRREVRLWTLTATATPGPFYERQGWAYDGTERELETLPAPDGTPVREVRYVCAEPTG